MDLWKGLSLLAMKRYKKFYIVQTFVNKTRKETAGLAQRNICFIRLQNSINCILVQIISIYV